MLRVRVFWKRTEIAYFGKNIKDFLVYFWVGTSALHLIWLSCEVIVGRVRNSICGKESTYIRVYIN